MWNPQHRPCTAEPEPAGLKGINPSDFGFGAVLLSWRNFHFSRALGTVSSPGTPEVRIYPSKAACGHRWGLQERTGMESSILPGCDPCSPGPAAAAAPAPRSSAVPQQIPAVGSSFASGSPSLSQQELTPPGCCCCPGAARPGRSRDLSEVWSRHRAAAELQQQQLCVGVAERDPAQGHLRAVNRDFRTKGAV